MLLGRGSFLQQASHALNNLNTSMATETMVLEEQEKETLDKILRPHLRLDPVVETKIIRRSTDSSASIKTKTLEKQFSRPTVHQTTVETDNKKRPGIMRRNSERYLPVPPEEFDPNSEAKSAVISKMHSNLEDWEKRLQDITLKKKENDEAHKLEIEKRDKEISDLSEKLNNETDLRTKTEQERNKLSDKLKFTETELSNQTQMAQQLHSNLITYEEMYQQTEERRLELEQENEDLTEKVKLMEEMKRRLNDQVTDLQGQVSILERRSSICVLM